jgi:formylglycine-generating enzyme required for sulfatase activity
MSKGYIYSGSNIIDDVAWYTDNSSRISHQCGTKAPNELGIYDMSGNVGEWCSDWYDKDYYASSPSLNPTGPKTGLAVVCRGGTYSYRKQSCRVSYRDFSDANARYANIGFRLVCRK